jgi:hypothetical protein
MPCQASSLESFVSGPSSARSHNTSGLVQEASSLAAPSVTASGTWLTSSKEPLVALYAGGVDRGTKQM